MFLRLAKRYFNRVDVKIAQNVILTFALEFHKSLKADTDYSFQTSMKSVWEMRVRKYEKFMFDNVSQCVITRQIV